MMETEMIQPDFAVTMERRKAILDFEDALSHVEGAVFGDSDLAPVEHLYAGGMYIRRMCLKAGSFATGKIHLHEHPAMLLRGEISVISETEGSQRIKAPCLWISPPGTKRAVYVHEDTEWVTIHLNPEGLKDPKELEKQLVASSYDELPESMTRNLL